MKTTLYNYSGKPVAFYQIQKQPLSLDGGSGVDQSMSHHIMIVDRSGSMYYDISELKNYLKKLLTLQEYVDPNQKISLISYSSSGDLKVHFNRVAVSEVMDNSSVYASQIETIRASGLTCISQALEKAEDLIVEGDLTGISLHSDGYANHYSRNDEVKKLNAICSRLAEMDGVFVNTIAYSSAADYQLLSSISNQVSGFCIRAQNIKQVFDVLQSTATGLSQNIAPTITSFIEDYDYQVLVSKKANRVNGADGDMKISGLSSEDNAYVLKFKKVSEEVYNSLSDEQISKEGLYAFSKAQLAEGNLNLAKYALVSTRDQTMLEKHYRALTNAQLADFSEDLGSAIMDGTDKHNFSTEYGLSNTKASVIALCDVINSVSKDVRVNLTHLNTNYVRRGLRKVLGVRNEKGEVVPPSLTTIPVHADEYVSIRSFDISRNKANINMLVAQPVYLADVETKKPILSVAGISLDKLNNFRNYTVVGDGEVSLSEMKVRVSTKKTFKVLKDFGAVTGEFHPEEDYTITFGDRPVVDFEQESVDLQNAFEQVSKLKVLSSILSAVLKTESETYSKEQLEELKNNYLSGNLNINFPTTTPYTSLDDALSKGEVDVRPTYKVFVGSTEILNQTKLKSANAFLQRFFTLSINGVEEKKPTFETFFEDTVYGYKTISSRTKIDAVDDLMKPIFEDLLGLQDNGALQEVLALCGREALTEQIKTFVSTKDKDSAVEVLTQLSKDANRAMEQVYNTYITPLSFYVGSTGLLPDNLSAVAEDAESIGKRNTNLKFASKEKDGTFFQIGKVVISVYTDNEYFSVSR